MIQSRKSYSIYAFLGILVLVLCLSLTPAVFAQTDTTTPANPTQLFTDLYNQVTPSVVAINVVISDDNGIIGGGAGSGFVIDTEGHIVTNNHVVDGASRIEVQFFDGTLARAEVVGLDPNSDLAVLQVDLPAEDLVPVELGNSDAIRIGETVLAIGSPFGQEWTLTSGIISGTERTIQGLTDFSIGGVIQTDAAINPGNSGGPLLNLEGQVIGVNSQILSQSGSNSGVGFAIPSELVQRVAAQLIDKGYVEYSYLGIRGGDVTLSLIEYFDLPNDFRGVVVGESTAGGPADRAGINDAGDTVEESELSVPQTVDIITAINGTPITGIADLITYLARETAPGDTITLSVLRNGTEQLDIEVRLVPRP